MNTKYCIIGMLLIAVLVSGCGGGKTSIVSSESSITGGFVAEQGNTECESAGPGCVKEFEDGRATGEYIKMGEVKEGGSFKMKIGDAHLIDQVCTVGLSPIIDAEEDGEGCEYEEDEYFCVNCPNGNCAAPENKCNCPQDCR